MSHMTDDELDAIDLAVVAFQDAGEWEVVELDEDAVDSIGSIADELRRYPSDSGALAMLSVDEDFVILVRVVNGETRVLLSDASAATDWSLARSAMRRIGVRLDDLDQQVPVGSLDIVEDLGLDADEMIELLEDLDLETEELLSEIADALGCGELFDEYVGLEE